MTSLSQSSNPYVILSYTLLLLSSVSYANKQDALTGSTEVGIAITLKHCTQNPCEDTSEALGSVLYSGPYNPQFGPGMGGQPYQNFTLTIPGGIQSGPAVLSVAHANLIGVSGIFS